MRRAPAPALESGRTACDVGQATRAVRSQGDVFFDAERRADPIRRNRSIARRRKPSLLAVVGTRPEVIKMAPVIQALSQPPTCFETRLCVVSQHTDILEGALEEFSLPVAFRISIESRGDLTATLAAAMEGVRGLLARNVYAGVIAQGDTTTTLAASLAAFYSGVPLALVEAGLRTGNMCSPFPEEMHRTVASTVATVLYAPTEQARANLLREHIPADRIVLVGNTVADALPPALPTPGKEKRILVTCHRRENFGRGVEDVCWALRRLLDRRPDIRIDFVLHPNPLAGAVPAARLRNCARLTLHPPLPHAQFIALLQRSTLVLTDSGGVQEESACLARPALILRSRTDRMESVEKGAAWVVGTDPFPLVKAIEEVLEDSNALGTTLADAMGVYGDGRASKRIRDDLTRRFARWNGEDDGAHLFGGATAVDRLADRSTRNAGRGRPVVGEPHPLRLRLP
ncbi:MAG: UDP-N-acetylglucosamine 2-epimerase (non-hydrolyzing) [Myxococcota bacterium]|nr:UDP-N-acetylglucosamine 2-epimerase (non-hydrolyzing) [Myxococcota bacterium]